MNTLFECDIYDWVSWGNVFQSKAAFEPLVRHIYETEKLPFEYIENLTPGTNAVFKAGNTVVKIFAPRESGMNAQSDYDTEIFGLKRANMLNIPSPKLLANGCICDKYNFLYLVTDFIIGNELVKIENKFTAAEKEKIGHKLRIISDRLNTPCERFNGIDVLKRAISAKQWNHYPKSFVNERLDWLKRYKIENEVFVHGDFNPDNILVDEIMNLYVIDFADSVLAPAEYELAAVVCETFNFEKSYMNGFFGKNYCVADIAEKCFKSVLMHDFGEGIIKNNFGKPDEITSLSVLRERIFEVIKQGKEFLDE